MKTNKYILLLLACFFAITAFSQSDINLLGNWDYKRRETVFEKMYRALGQKGVLVTYSVKGSVRRALQAAGFEVERLPGPPGKREMLRGTKDLEML